MDTIYAEKTQLSEQQKSIIRNMAKAANLSVDDFLWRAALAFKSPEEQQAISSLFHQLKQSAARIDNSIDHTIAYIDASNQRIAETERKAWQELPWAS